jgi:hypothetical protein
MKDFTNNVRKMLKLKTQDFNRVWYKDLCLWNSLPKWSVDILSQRLLQRMHKLGSFTITSKRWDPSQKNNNKKRALNAQEKWASSKKWEHNSFREWIQTS